MNKTNYNSKNKNNILGDDIHAAGPQTLIQLLKLLLKGMIVGFRAKILIMICLSLLTWLVHTYLLVVENNGFDPSNSQFTYMLALKGAVFSGTLFWTLLGMIIMNIFYKVIQGKLKHSIKKMRSSPKWVRQSIGQAGSFAFPIILGTSALALYSGVKLNNPLVNLLLAFLLAGSIIAQQESLLALALHLSWSDAHKLLKKPVKKFKISWAVMVITGGAIGFTLAIFLVDSTFFVYLFVLIMVGAMIAFIFGNKDKTGGRAVPVLFILIFICMVATIPAFADDGGWKESGGTFDKWIVSEGALIAILLGLPPAMGMALGVLIGSTIAQGIVTTGGQSIAVGGITEGISESVKTPDWVDSDFELEQLEWYRQGLEDNKMRLESLRQHRQNDPDFTDRAKDMQRSIDYYQEKINEQQTRIKEWGITPGEHRPVNKWDPFSVTDSEKKIRQWDDAWNKFTKIREGAEKREHWLYSDSEKWDQAMDNIFKDDLEVDYDALNRARTVFNRAIDADIDTMAPEHRHWVNEATIQTVRDAKNNPVVRMGAAYLSGGTSEIFFEPLDQLEKMHDYVQYHDRGGSDLEAVAGAFIYGVEELAKDKLAVREIRTITTWKVELPDGTLKDATTLDYALSLFGLGMKGKDFYSTTVRGEFWDSKAFGIDTNKVRDKGSEMFDNLMGRRQGSSVPEAEGASIRGMDNGVDTRAPGTDAEGGGVIIPGEGTSKQPKIPPAFADDYKAMQRAIANGDETTANRYATRMLAKDSDGFKMLVKDGTFDEKTAQRAVQTHQKIVQEGVKKGLEKTKQMGNLLEDKIHIDEHGNMTVESPIKNVWSPGSGMDEFNSKKGVPGDTDLTTVMDRKLCSQRGLDPDDVQRLTAGHIKDQINEAARKHLGDDIGNYNDKTKINHLTPGSDEEYFGYKTHEMKGNSITNDGEIVRNKTTLGEECWPGSKEIADTVSNSKTGRAMAAADESFQIKKTIDNIKNPTGAEYLETTRELCKHHDRLEKSAEWKIEDIDKSKLNSSEGFKETLEAVKKQAEKKGTADIKQAIDDYFDGDYNKFYKDLQESSNQAIQTKLDEGGKIWDAQADRLPDQVKVNRDNIIKHTAVPETKSEYLNRLGANDEDL